MLRPGRKGRLAVILEGEVNESKRTYSGVYKEGPLDHLLKKLPDFTHKVCKFVAFLLLFILSPCFRQGLLSVNDLEALRVIGQGESGVVKKARHTLTNALYALKVIKVKDVPVSLGNEVITEVKNLYNGEYVVSIYDALFKEGIPSSSLMHLTYYLSSPPLHRRKYRNWKKKSR